MKVVILAGGFGTRISEESHLKPKPMIEIGGKPILWHIMKEYSYYGYNEFIICCGYKQHVVKEWFADYYLHNSDVTFDFTRENYMEIHSNVAEPWKVTLVDTGLNTMTGGRSHQANQILCRGRAVYANLWGRGGERGYRSIGTIPQESRENCHHDGCQRGTTVRCSGD